MQDSRTLFLLHLRYGIWYKISIFMCETESYDFLHVDCGTSVLEVGSGKGYQYGQIYETGYFQNR